MTQTLMRSYATYTEAKSAVAQLEAANIPSADISIVGKHDDAGGDSAAEGAGIGAVLGGAAGILASLGMLAIPGIGPVVAAGWLASTAAGVSIGAVAGGLVGMLVNAGVDEEDANYYAETLRRGGSVVAVRVDDAYAARVETVLDRTSPINQDAHRSAYRKEGWTRFDDKAPPYVGI